MAVLTRIGPASAFKVGLVVYAIFGLIPGVFCSAVALAGVPFGAHEHVALPGAMGLLPVLVCPIIWGVVGGIAAVIGALIYNLVSNWVGGVEVDIH